MNIKNWAKTILTVQKYLDRVCASVDECIEKKSTSSFNVTSRNIYQNNCFYVSNFMIDLMERKKNLINLRVICNDALNGIDLKYAKILVLKYIDRMKTSTIIELLGLSERTYYRRLNTAYEVFGEYLEEHGFDATYFVKNYENEGWITETYYEIEKENGRGDNVITFTPFYINRICAAMSK